VDETTVRQSITMTAIKLRIWRRRICIGENARR
jgi:hypothetical protein